MSNYPSVDHACTSVIVNLCNHEVDRAVTMYSIRCVTVDECHLCINKGRGVDTCSSLCSNLWITFVPRLGRVFWVSIIRTSPGTKHVEDVRHCSSYLLHTRAQYPIKNGNRTREQGTHAAARFSPAGPSLLGLGCHNLSLAL